MNNYNVFSVSMRGFFKEFSRDFKNINKPFIISSKKENLYERKEYIKNLFLTFAELFLENGNFYFNIFKTINAITFESMYIYLNINSLLKLGIVFPILNSKNFLIKDNITLSDIFNRIYIQSKMALNISKNILIENIILIKLNYSLKNVQGSVIFYNRDFIRYKLEDMNIIINNNDNTFDDIINKTKSYPFIEIKDYGKIINILE